MSGSVGISRTNASLPGVFWPVAGVWKKRQLERQSMDSVSTNAISVSILLPRRVWIARDAGEDTVADSFKGLLLQCQWIW